MQTTEQDKEEPPRDSRWLLGVGRSLELLLIGFAIILKIEEQLQCPSGRNVEACLDTSKDTCQVGTLWASIYGSAFQYLSSEIIKYLQRG